MVTFSTRDSPEELNKKFKIKLKEDNIIISDEEFNESYKETTYECPTCGGVMQYDKVEQMCWCNNNQCLKWYPPADAKKVVDFEIPQSVEDIEPAVYSIDSVGVDDVSVKKKVEYKGGIKALAERGLRITDYNEGSG